MREVIPAQRKLAKLVRPDSKKNAQLAKQTKVFLQKRVREHQDVEDRERKESVVEQKKAERQAVQRRKETQRARYLASFRRPQTANQVETSKSSDKLQQEDINITETLMRDVHKRKKRAKSARRKRERSHQFAKSFMSANNATSRHIAKGNAMRRKRQEEFAVRRRVAQARWTTEQRAAVMREASLRRQAQKQAKIDAARVEYINMLEWRKNMDIQKLEMARLRKQYQRDLTHLVQRVQRGELDQPVWNVDQPPREMLERTMATQLMVPTRPTEHRGISMGYGAYNGGGREGGRLMSRGDADNDESQGGVATIFSTGPTMSREITLK